MGSVDTIINIIEETRDYIIVTLPIFIPDTRDCEYDQGEKPLTAEQIQRFAEEYLDWKIVDLEHEFLYNGQVIGTLMEKRERFPDFDYYRRESRLRRSSLKRKF